MFRLGEDLGNPVELLFSYDKFGNAGTHPRSPRSLHEGYGVVVRCAAGWNRTVQVGRREEFK